MVRDVGHLLALGGGVAASVYAAARICIDRVVVVLTEGHDEAAGVEEPIIGAIEHGMDVPPVQVVELAFQHPVKRQQHLLGQLPERGLQRGDDDIERLVDPLEVPGGGLALELVPQRGDLGAASVQASSIIRQKAASVIPALRRFEGLEVGMVSRVSQRRLTASPWPPLPAARLRSLGRPQRRARSQHPHARPRPVGLLPGPIQHLLLGLVAHRRARSRRPPRRGQLPARTRFTCTGRRVAKLIARQCLRRRSMS